MGALMPVESITWRVAMGCSFGLPVRPGSWVAAEISAQMSSSVYGCSCAHWRKYSPLLLGTRLSRGMLRKVVEGS